MQPEAVSRPESWPSGPPAGGNLLAPSSDSSSASPRNPLAELSNAALDASRSQQIEGARVLGYVNSEVILYSEVAGYVNDVLMHNADKIPPEQLAMQREYLIAVRLKQLVETKLIYAEAKRSIQAKSQEGWTKFVEDVGKDFETRELPEKLLKRAKVATRQELAAKYESMGTSLEREKRAYIEKAIAQHWLYQQTNKNDEIPPQTLWAYYQEHAADYSYPAQVRWEHLMVKKERYREEESLERLCQLGNQVLSGAPLAGIAKQVSEAPDASSGGQHDWTTLDELATGDMLISAELQHALETLPVGRLSKVIDDDQGYHIVRVVDRRPAGRRPFEEVQSKIKETLRNERFEEAVSTYVENLQHKATIRTAYDNHPIQQIIAEQEARTKQR